MAEFDVFPIKIKCKAGNLKSAKNKLDGYAATVLEISSNLHFSGLSASIIRSKLAFVASDIKEESKKAGVLASSLESVADCYEAHEKQILNAAEDGEISFMEFIGQRVSVEFEPKAKTKKKIVNRREKTFKKGFYDKDGKWHDRAPSKDEKGYDKEGYYDDDDVWHDGKNPKESKKKVTDYLEDVKIVSATAEDEASVFEKRASNEYGEGEIKLLSAEYHASGHAGLFGFDEDGNKIFRPGFGGTCGLSATAFTANGKLELGDDNLGAYVGGDVTVGRLAAEGEVKVGFDKDGKVAVYAGGSAEAIAAEVNVNGGVKVAGTDVKGQVGVNVGVGAHGNVGYHDGKFSLDFGVAVGVGVSASLEIDVSGTVDMIVNSKAAQVVTEGITEIGKATGDALKKGVTEMGKVVAGWFG